MKPGTMYAWVSATNQFKLINPNVKDKAKRFLHTHEIIVYIGTFQVDEVHAHEHLFLTRNDIVRYHPVWFLDDLTKNHLMSCKIT
jgi:hypothetical protein